MASGRCGGVGGGGGGGSSSNGSGDMASDYKGHSTCPRRRSVHLDAFRVSHHSMSKWMSVRYAICFGSGEQQYLQGEVSRQLHGTSTLGHWHVLGLLVPLYLPPLNPAHGVASGTLTVLSPQLSRWVSTAALYSSLSLLSIFAGSSSWSFLESGHRTIFSRFRP